MTAALTLLLKQVADFYVGILPEKRDAPGFVEGHQLDPSVLTTLVKNNSAKIAPDNDELTGLH